MAIDKRTGKTLWERTAAEGEPLNKRHVKNTYASATPATDGRMVVAWFGSQGVVAYDVNGTLRWKVDLGRLDLGAYDIPSVEWGPASSPIIWKDLVILQVDTQADSFVIALKLETGETVWKTERDELPSWGTPTVADTSAGPSAHQRVEVHPRLRPAHRQGAVAARRQFQDHRPHAVRRRGPPRLCERAGTRAADLRRPTRGPWRPHAARRKDEQRRGGLEPDRPRAYMPTPLAYGGLLYVLGNAGVLDVYRLRTGEEVYRQRLPVIGERIQRLAGGSGRQD